MLRDKKIFRFPGNNYDNTVNINNLDTVKIDTDKIFYIHNQTKDGEDFIEDSIPFENEAVQYWKVFFDFSYYTLLTPFRFSWDGVNGLYKCKRHLVQRLLQWTLYSFTTVYFLLRVQAMSKMDPIENPSLYFQVAYYFFDTTFLVVLFLSFGRQAKMVSKVFSDLQINNNRFYQLSRNAKKTRRICAAICIGCLGTLLLQILETLKDNNWSMTGFWNYWNEDAAWAFGDNLITRNCPYCLGILAVTGSLLEKLLNAFSDVLFTMTVLMWHNLVNSFYMDMQKVGEAHMPTEVLEHYWWLKYITGEINSAMSLINGAFIAGNLPFYATNVFEVFGDANIFMRLRYMFYCSYWYPSLFIAAHANSKLEFIKNWICKEENYSRIPDKKLRVFLHEIHYHTVGVGSFGIITVTWNSVGSIISIIMTYALLKSQLRTMAPSDTENDKIMENAEETFNGTSVPENMLWLG